MIYKTSIYGLGLLISTALMQDKPAFCETDTYICTTSDIGIVVSKTDDGEAFLPLMQKAAATFEKHFAQKPKPIALGLGGSVNNELTEQLRNAGYESTLPWLTFEQKEASLQKRIRKQIKKQKPDLPDPAIDKIVAEQMNGLKKRGIFKSEEMEAGIIAHELSHLWFRLAYYPNSKPKDKTQYGSDAADWLDELSAVLVENEILTKTRTKVIKEIVKTENFTRFWPLTEYFKMEHPLLKQVANLRTQAKKQGGSSIIIKSLDEFDLGENARNPADFYAQSRSMADYFQHKSGNSAIFHSIASHIAGGNTMENWLSKYGKTHNIPINQIALEADWKKWMKDFYAG